MFEFVAIGRERNQYWRRELAPDQVIRLGRMQDSGWEVPWDRRISRDHADLVLQGDRLLVRCLPSARNSAYIVDAPLREFSIVAGEQFRIGDTVFRLELASARTPLDQIDEFFRSESTEFRTEPGHQQEVSALRDELVTLRQKLAESKEKPAVQEDSQSQIADLLTNIQDVKDLWETESGTLRDANQRLEAKNKNLVQEIVHLQSLVEKREDERRLSDEALLQHQQDFTAFEQRCKELTDALGAAQEDHEQLEQNAKLQQAKVQNLRPQFDDLKSQLGEEKQALQQSEAQTRQLSQELSSLRSELAQLREQTGSAATKEDAQEHALRRAKEASQKATATAYREARTVARQRTEIESLQSNAKSIKAELEKATGAVQHTQRNSDRLHDELEALKVKLESLNSQLTEAEAAHRQQELEARQQSELATQSVRENEALRAEADSLRAEMASKEASLRKADLTARHKAEEAEQYSIELKELRSEVITLRVRVEGGSGPRVAKSSGAPGDIEQPDEFQPVPQEGSTLATPLAIGNFGQYKIIEQIGQGGMGTVFKAIHTRLERIVALKIVTGGRLQSRDKLARFDREMKAIGRLSHANLVQALDAGENNHCLYLVMEFVDGLDVAELVRKLGPLAIADACEIVRQTALGLDYIHKQDLVHRDIKPSNLMITRDQQVKILDLGLALLGDLGDGLTQTGQVMGTLDYISPEQVGDSHQVDSRADIYSLGCTFYQLVTGKVPYSGARYGTVVKKIMAHVQAESPSLDEHRSDLPSQVVDVVSCMMAKSPDDRPRSLGEVADVLGPYCEGSSLSDLLVKARVMEPRAAAQPPTIRSLVDTTELTSSGQESDAATDFVPKEIAAEKEADANLDPWK